MSIRKTRQGQNIDLDKLRLQYERTVAAGNLNVNSRGDEISKGKVAKESKERIKPYYNKKVQLVKASSIKPKLEKTKEKKTKNTIDKNRERILENGNIVIDAPDEIIGSENLIIKQKDKNER